MRALVLEGGAMRAIFTAGVLDAMAANNEPAFDIVVGVSAGGYCAASYLAGQHERIKNIVERYMVTAKYVSPARMAIGGSLIDQDYLINKVTKELLPLDLDALKSTTAIFEVVTTHANTGEPCYITATDDDCLTALHATIAMPFFYKGGPIEFRNELHFDGSVSDPVPLTRAISLGASHVTVILTRAVSWEPPPLGVISRLAVRASLSSYPGVYNALINVSRAYRSARFLLDSPPPGVELRVITPPSGYQVSRFTRDPELIQTGYRLGREAI
jgi:predicted patatin/cPLA2 family phospholipase